MKPELERLEHLFSRAVDGECRPDELRTLAALTREHADIASALDEYRRFDALVGAVLRDDAGRAPQRRPAPAPRRLRLWVGRGLGLAAAAGLLIATSFAPRGAPAPRASAGRTPQQAGLTAWFGPPPTADAVEQTPTEYVRPDVRVRGTQREWIVIPGDRPGTFMVVQVDRVRTHVINVHQDF